MKWLHTACHHVSRSLQMRTWFESMSFSGGRRRSTEDFLPICFMVWRKPPSSKCGKTKEMDVDFRKAQTTLSSVATLVEVEVQCSSWQQTGLEIQQWGCQDRADSTFWGSSDLFRCASRCCTSFISLLLPIQFSLQLSVGGAASGPETPRYFTKSLRRLAPQGGCGEKDAVETADLSVYTLFIRHNLS